MSPRPSGLSARRLRFATTPAVSPAILLLSSLLLAPVACGRAGERAAQDVLHAIDQGKLIGTRGTMESVGKALTAYAMDRGGYPPGASIQEANAVLVSTFLPSPVSVDAWGNTLVYASDGKTFTLTSPGGDGRIGGDDDLVMVDGRFTRVPGPPTQ